VRIGQLPARVVAAAGMTGYQVGRRTLPTWAPVPPALAGHVGRDVVLGLRAEDVRIASGDMDPDLGTLSGTVRSAERNGRDAFVTIQIDGHRVVARMPGRTDVRTGDAVTVAIDASKAHVFESTTGRALAHPSY
jgi:multiple sugar transport system ATP-binding protein